MDSLRFASRMQSTAADSEQTEELTSKDDRLAVPVILMDSDGWFAVDHQFDPVGSRRKQRITVLVDANRLLSF